MRMSFVTALWFLAAMASHSLGGPVAFESKPRDNAQTIVIPRVQTPPAIDGDLSDPAWEQASVVKAFWKGGSDDTAEHQTNAWITFDSDNLYVAFACQDELVQTDHYPHDDKHIWQRDSVEVHLSPARDPLKVYQFIVGAGGSTFDRLTSDDPLAIQVQWNPAVKWESAVKRQDYGYSVEIRIPFAAVLDRELFDVGRGTWWQAKLARVDFGGHKGSILSSWTRIGSYTSDRYSLGDLFFESRDLLGDSVTESIDSHGGITHWRTMQKGVELNAAVVTQDTDDGRTYARYEIRGEPAEGKVGRIYPGSFGAHRSPAETTYRFSADVSVDASPGALVCYLTVFNGSEIHRLPIKQNAGWQHIETLVMVGPGEKGRIPAIQVVPTRGSDSPEDVAPGGVVKVDNVRLESIHRSSLAGDPDAHCLTGNATGALRSRNMKVDGAYTYREPGTTGGQFPDYLQNQSPPDAREYDGWINFKDGILTDGLTSTGVRWGTFWSGSLGHEVVLDLKQDMMITHVVVLGHDVHSAQVFLKATHDPKYVLAASNLSLFEDEMNQEKIHTSNEGLLDKLNQPARWVRVQIQSRTCVPSEIQVWGKTWDGKTVTRRPYLQNQGRTPVSTPVGEPVDYPADMPKVYPIPQELKLVGSPLPLHEGMTIAWPSAGGQRARTTAEVLAREMLACYDLRMNVVEGEVGDIVLSQGLDAPDKQDGYLLRNTSRQVIIQGHDPRGLFYGVQTLLSLVRRSKAEGWELPGAEIRDWPDMPIRYIQGRLAPDENLVRALARYRVTHYETQPRYLAQAAAMDELAARYFVEMVPELSFNAIVLKRDPGLAERAPDEPLDSLAKGRRNASPADPVAWEIYQAELDKWLPQFHSSLVHISYDETYQTQGGARWNVSDASRKLGLSAGALIAWQINRIDTLAKKHGKSIVMHDTAFMVPAHTLSYPGDPDPSWLEAIPLLPRDVKFLVWHPTTAGPVLHKAGFDLLDLVLDEIDWRDRRYPDIFKGAAAYMADSAFTPARLINLVGVAWNLDAPRARDKQASFVTTANIPVWRRIADGVTMPSLLALDTDFTSIDISKATNRSRRDEVAYDGKGFVDMGANVDLIALKSGKRKFANIPFTIIDEENNGGQSIVMVHNRAYADKTLPASVTIDLSPFEASSLLFLHCLDQRPGQSYLRRRELAGFYVIEYVDGTYGRCELKYAVNIANWTGRPTNSGYSPKGHAMTDGFLAWHGQTTSGMPAYLYATEWVNPRPDKTIVRLHVRSTDRVSQMNPMLLAVTAVNPQLAKQSDQRPQMPSIKRLEEAQPVGTFYDLRGGVDETAERYLAPDGTSIQASKIYNTLSQLVRWDGLEYVSKVGMINIAGNYSMVRAPEITFNFPKPTHITGALVTGGYRVERKEENFDPVIHNYTLSVSTDRGATWSEHGTANNISPEELGPQWMPVTLMPITNLRIQTKVVSGRTYGFEQIQLFRESNDGIR